MSGMLAIFRLKTQMEIHTLYDGDWGLITELRI